MNIVYAFGLGYGANMAWSGGARLLVLGCYHAAGADCASATGLADHRVVASVLYGAYGARLFWYLARRQIDQSYQPKMHTLTTKTAAMPAVARLGICTFVGLAQALYAVPLRRAQDLAGPAPWVALGVAAVGLLVEAVADEQKLAHKRVRPGTPVMTGLYSRCRFPAYTGEILFHAGVAAYGLAAGAGFLPAVCPTAFMIWVMVGAAKRLDATQLDTYGGTPSYRGWRARTGRLVPALGAF